MPSMLTSLSDGFTSFKKGAEGVFKKDAIESKKEGAKLLGKSETKAAATVIKARAAVVLGAPVLIAKAVHKDYRTKQNAEHQRERMEQLAGALRSHGISIQGAMEMAHNIIKGTNGGHYLSTADIKMWMVVASTILPELAEYTPAILERAADNKVHLG